jgi:hypothetical protein
MRLPWGPKARARRLEAVGRQLQDQQRAEAFARIAAQARTDGNAPTSYLPLNLAAPLLTRHQANRSARP